jgi:hypothetical protein
MGITNNLMENFVSMADKGTCSADRHGMVLDDEEVNRFLQYELQ